MGSCYGRPYAFEAVPDAQLQGNVRKSLVVPDEAACLSACLKGLLSFSASQPRRRRFFASEPTFT